MSPSAPFFSWDEERGCLNVSGFEFAGRKFDVEVSAERPVRSAASELSSRDRQKVEKDWTVHNWPVKIRKGKP